MANSSLSRVAVLRAMQFAAAAAIVLWPAGGWAQNDSQAYFTPLITLKVEARSAPAKVTTEAESALTSKGYVKIGTILASQPGKKTGAEATEGLRAAALSKAAAAGGDVVRFAREGALEKTSVGTGKYSRDCAQSHEFSSGDGRGGIRWTTICDRWEQGAEKTKTVEDLVSEGTVWRYDPNLPAEIAFREDSRSEKGFSQFQDMLSRGQYAEAERFLAQGADANASDHNGWTHLDFAAFRGNVEGVKMLLAHGADVNAKDNSGNTPLHNAAFCGKKELAELILAHGANVNARNGIGSTPLHEASSTEVAELFLARGADVNAKDSVNATPLHSATQRGANEVAGLLLAHGADVNAADITGDTPLHAAASSGHKELAVLLLAHGADVNARDHNGDTPLWWARWSKSQEIVDLLLRHGGEDAAPEAARKAETAEIAFRPWKSLNFEAKDGSPVKEAELRLAQGADINAKDEWGRTPLHKAAREDNKELTALLLAHGANVNARDESGYTPLHSTHQADESELLLAHGADVNARDDKGQTPLHNAASDDPKDYKGLGRAVIKLTTQWDLARIEVLLAHGADVNAKDNDGRTPLSYAKIGDVARLLQQHGGHK